MAPRPWRTPSDRQTERPEAHLHGFADILQVDGYGAYAALARRHQQIRLAFCWAHVRLKFYELAEGSPVATDVLRRIASLYAIEDEIRGLSAAERRDVRDQRSRPIIDDLYRFPKARGRQVSAKSRLGEAIRYTLPRWEGLIRFLDDGRIDLDNNAVERAIRPLALNRKNALFAGSDEGGGPYRVASFLKQTHELLGRSRVYATNKFIARTRDFQNVDTNGNPTTVSQVERAQVYHFESLD